MTKKKESINNEEVIELGEKEKLTEILSECYEVAEVECKKENIDDYFDIFSLWFRDVLLFKATKEVDSLVFKQELNGIRARANKSSYEGLEKIIESIQKARTRLNANVNFDLTMDLMFLTMKEN